MSAPHHSEPLLSKPIQYGRKTRDNYLRSKKAVLRFKRKMLTIELETIVRMNINIYENRLIPEIQDKTFTEKYNKKDVKLKDHSGVERIGVDKYEDTISIEGPSWSQRTKKAWEEFIKLSPTTLGSVNGWTEIVAPKEIAWPKPPANMDVDLGSLITIAMVNAIYCDGVYEIDSNAKAEIEKTLRIPFVLPNEPFVLLDPNKVPDIETPRYTKRDLYTQLHTWRVAKTPDRLRLWNLHTGSPVHGLMHYGAPPDVYRWQQPSAVTKRMAGHQQLSGAIIHPEKAKKAFAKYVGFTFYRRPKPLIYAEKYLQPSSSGLNAHKFRTVEIKGEKYELSNSSASMPPNWIKALFGCLHSYGLFEYLGKGIVTDKKWRKDIEVKKLIKIPEQPKGNIRFMKVRVPFCRNTYGVTDLDKNDDRVSFRYHGTEYVRTGETRCQVCGEEVQGASKVVTRAWCMKREDGEDHGFKYMSRQWPGRCLRCNPILVDKYPTWNNKKQKWEWREVPLQNKANRILGRKELKKKLGGKKKLEKKLEGQKLKLKELEKDLREDKKKLRKELKTGIGAGGFKRTTRNYYNDDKTIHVGKKWWTNIKLKMDLDQEVQQVDEDGPPPAPGVLNVDTYKQSPDSIVKLKDHQDTGDIKKKKDIPDIKDYGKEYKEAD
jgi:hypothetical protein